MDTLAQVRGSRRRHEHQERAMRAMRQEPAEGHRLRVVHVHRHRDRRLHLRVRRGGQEHGQRKRVVGLCGRLDGESCHTPHSEVETKRETTP